MIDEKDLKSLVNALPVLRKSMNLTGDQFGYFLGWSKQSVSKYERSVNNITVDKYIAVRYVIDSWIKQHPEDRHVPKIVAMFLDGTDIYSTNWTNKIFN